MKAGIVLPHVGASGGIRRLRRIAAGLAQRGYQVSTVTLGEATARARHWSEIPAICRSLDCLICPGDLPLWQLAPLIPDSCSLHTFHLHLGMHDWRAEEGNIRSPRIRKATSARWIQERIRRMGADCAWFGIAPFDEEVHFEPADRLLRIGTLAHACYGWKNTRAVFDALPEIERRCPGVELWVYGQTSMPTPGRFFLNPDNRCRRRIYGHCRVWVVPSISEGIGMCGLEAMLCRTPVVSADNRGIREYADENTCLLFPPSAHQEMVRHVVSLLRDWELGARMAERAFVRVSRLNFEDCLDRIESILRDTEAV